jgi:hypothetical protein
MHNPGNPRAPKGRGGACLLVSCPLCDPIGGAAGSAAPKVQLGSPRALMELKIRLRFPVDQEPKVWASPRALSGGRIELRLGWVSWPEGARERTRWV